MSGVVLSLGVVFLVASFSMAEFSDAALGDDGGRLDVDVFGASVVDIIVIELIIRSIIETGFSVVPSFALGGRDKKTLSDARFFPKRHSKGVRNKMWRRNLYIFLLLKILGVF